MYGLYYIVLNTIKNVVFLHFLVQHECIPQAILGMDVVCQAKSGMGKTAVFVLATLQQLEPVAGQVKWSIIFICHQADKLVYKFEVIILHRIKICDSQSLAQFPR